MPQRIEELQKTLEAKAAQLRLKVRAEKLEKLPAEVRKDFQQAAYTPEDKRTELQKYLVEKFKTALEVSNQELNRFDDYRELAREIQPKIGAERAKLRPAPSLSPRIARRVRRR